MEDGEKVSFEPAKKPFILFRIWQVLVVAILGLWTLILIGAVFKLDAPGAPVVPHIVTVVGFVVLVVIHSPKLFFRMSGKARAGVYVATLGALIISAIVLDGVGKAYFKTPAGAKELAERVEREAREAKEAAVEEERKKAQERVEQLRKEKSAKEAVEAAGKEMNLLNCRTLSEDVIRQYKKSGRIEIIEINDISARPEAEPGQQLTCDASAITSSGDMRLQFGLERSPQGKDILSSKLD